jgi:hypothetical protein
LLSKTKFWGAGDAVGISCNANLTRLDDLTINNFGKMHCRNGTTAFLSQWRVEVLNQAAGTRIPVNAPNGWLAIRKARGFATAENTSQA